MSAGQALKKAWPAFLMIRFSSFRLDLGEDYEQREEDE
jgi:hypothetical protein